MRNKFTLKEGEVQRILGLHKSAIIKENGVGKQNLTEDRNYGNPIINKGAKLVGDKNYFTVQNLTTAENPKGGSSLKFFKGVNFVIGSDGFLKSSKPVIVQFSDSANNTGSEDKKGTLVFNCKTKLMIVKDINDPTMSELYGYETSRNVYDLSLDTAGYTTLGGLRAVCDNIKEGVQGSSASDVKQENKNTGYAYTYIPGGKSYVSNNNGTYTTVNTPGRNMYFRCDAYKKDYHFKYGKVFYKNETLTTKFKSVFCSSNKPSHKQEMKQTFVSETSSKFSLDANTVWNWKSTGVENSSELNNTQKDEKLLKTAKSCGWNSIEEYKKSGWKCKQKNVRIGGSLGNRYTFDFDTIMKEIESKCKTQGSSQQTSEPTLTPTPEIDRTITKDLYQTLIAN